MRCAAVLARGSPIDFAEMGRARDGDLWKAWVVASRHGTENSIGKERTWRGRFRDVALRCMDADGTDDRRRAPNPEPTTATRRPVGPADGIPEQRVTGRRVERRLRCVFNGQQSLPSTPTLPPPLRLVKVTRSIAATREFNGWSVG
jgi:hypothetical protein